MYRGRAKNFARAIGLVPSFFKHGYSTVPGVYYKNYAVANVASVAVHATLQVSSRVDRVSDVLKWTRD